jgi:hypothetical protein
MRDHRHMTSQTSQGSKLRFLKFGSATVRQFGRFGVRSPEIFSFFDLQHLSSVSAFGFGGSAE